MKICRLTVCVLVACAILRYLFGPLRAGGCEEAGFPCKEGTGALRCQHLFVPAPRVLLLYETHQFLQQKTAQVRMWHYHQKKLNKIETMTNAT